MTIKVGFKKLSEDATIPTRAHKTDSGFDLYANEDVVIKPQETRIIKTDIAIVLPEGFEAQVRPRSGVTAKTKLRVQLGTIDQSYTGNIGIIIDNTAATQGVNGSVNISKDILGIDNELRSLSDIDVPRGSYLIGKGDRIAQLVIQELPKVEAYEVDNLPDTERGSGGFGSSGLN